VTEWVVFGTGTPASPNETDGPIAVSTGFQINDAGSYWCTGVEFYAASSAPTGVAVALWSRSTDESPSGLGTLLASRAASDPITGGVRNRILFTAAVPVSAALYATGLYATLRTGNNYVATGAYFAAGSVTSGPITAYQNGGGVGTNGRFKVSPTPSADGTDSYPNSQFNGGGYWVSPIVTDVDPTGTPVSVAGAVTAPARTMSGTAGVALVAAGAVAAPERTAAGSGVVPVTERPSGWGPLLDMFRTAKAQAGLTVPPVACPRCGEPLETARGVRHCRFDGYRASS
jgi:hypothetical protein